ncbi:ankyrin [Lipomyces oligophaga]|uniref:ankyrin n=1 Tax=Lipomyces oligophaga TaxID=45792 RepID=UPI0034CFD28A
MSNLWIAASDNNRAAIEALFLSGKNKPNDRDPYGYTALHAAASYSHNDLLRYLVEQGGDVNITDEEGETPLFAVENPETAKILVEELGADWKIKSEAGETAREKLQREIEEDGEPWTATVEYLTTIESGDTELVNSNDAYSLAKQIQEAVGENNAEVKVSVVQEPDQSASHLEDPQLQERRRKIQEALQSSNPEQVIRNLVEEAVRLELSDDPNSPNRSVRRKLEDDV